MRLLLLEPLVLDLEVEIALAEDVVVTCSSQLGRLVLPFRQPLGNFALKACGEADQSLRVVGEKLLADARLVIEPVQRGLGDDLHQVAIALVVLGQHDEMVVAVALGRRAMIFLLADVELATQDRLHARFLGGVHERYRAEDVAVIGHGDRRHLQLLDAIDETLDLARAVEHGEIGMQVKMDEFRLGHLLLFYALRQAAAS